METNEYLPMFLAESREHLQELNLAVMRIEESPGDTSTIDEIFRMAHSLKGMSATMGFQHIAALTHAMEDLFEVLRLRSGGLDRAAIDALLECLDALGAAFEAIDTEGVEALDEAPLVARLEALVRSESERPGGDGDKRPELGEILAAAGGRRVVHVVTRLDDATLMPSVRALMVLTAIADHGEVLTSLPAEDAVAGFDGKSIEIWLASDHEDEAVTADLTAVPDVVDVSCTEPQGSEPDGLNGLDPGALAGGESERSGVEESQGQAASSGGATERRSGATSSVRVDAERLDQLMHVMGELVVHRTHVESLLGQATSPGCRTR